MPGGRRGARFSMNFFEQQHHARRQTRTLVILFVLAVVAIVLAVNLVAAFLWTWGQPSFDLMQYPKGFFIANTAVTVCLIGAGTLVEIYNLRDGGEAVAQMAGGRPVSPATRDIRERRLLNVVEEMALASGVACPKVYVLDREESINAFAAGYNPNEAVVAVTRGTLARLTRDELQGVVGHEFSHILNGDMRLNVRLIGVLFGIQMVAGFGRQLLEFALRTGSPRRRDDQGPSLQALLLVMGISLLAIGYIGIFFGRLIKSAVSRQREFLADASAIQFTRNPDGIGNALRKIGGLSRRDKAAARIHHPNAEHLSHLFLSAVSPGLLSGMFATHPPIPERLRRIFGKGVELMEAPELPDDVAASSPLPDIPYVASGFAGAAGADGQGGSPAPAAAPFAFAAAAALPAGGAAGGPKTRLPQHLDDAAHEPQGATALVYALVLARHAGCDLSAQALQQHAPKQAAFAAYLAGSIAQLPPAARLPLLDLAMPALRQLPQDGRDALLAVVAHIIAADNKISLDEFVLETVLRQRLAAHAGRAVPVKFSGLRQLRDECRLLLSLFAHLGASRQAPAPEVAPAFLRGAALCADLEFTAADLQPPAQLAFAGVRQALDRANQLAPLAKPALLKALVAAASDAAELPMDIADTLRAACAALEAPLPPAVAAAYAGCEFLTAA